VERAAALGWRAEQIQVIDEDLGLSGAGTAERAGFARLAAEVALGRVGIVLGLEASRLARNNADWYRLLDLCAMTDTLIGDGDGLYHPAQFNDRLLLGLKGTMSEAELHIIRARLDGGIRNKAARGELRRALPVGLVWGEADGEVRLHPDAAVCAAVRTVFERFAELGSARRVWLWFRAEGLSFPLQSNTLAEIRWVEPTYTAIHKVLTHPAYAGAYAYGRSRHERSVDASGQIRKRVRRLPRAQWAVLIRDHHPGFIDWATYEANQQRLATNTHPAPHAAGGAGARGRGAVTGAGGVRPVRAAVAYSLPGSPRCPWLPLRRQNRGQRPWALLSERRRGADRRGGYPCLPRSPHTGGIAGGGAGRRAA
jgi:DNA invertase Pin-like site-specific DNA recombinase